MQTKKSSKKQSHGICEIVAEKPSGFGKKMMEKLGWKEGQGLGVNNQGKPEHIRVSKKDDTKGIGANRSNSESEQQWWNDAFKKAAASLPESTKKKDSKSSSSSSSESDESDSEDVDDHGLDLSQLSEADRELFLMCGKRRLGRRANRPQKGKWKREALADKLLKEQMESKLKQQPNSVTKTKENDRKRVRRDSETA